MKRFISILLILLIVASIPAFAAGAVSNGEEKVYHASSCGSKLYLRKGAGTDYDIICCLPNGTALVKKCCTNGWWKVKTMNGKTGWIEAKHIRDHARANVNTPKSGLNVRSGRSMSSGILYSIPHGTKNVTVYKKSGNWAYVKWGGHKKGWASLSYLKWTRW